MYFLFFFLFHFLPVLCILYFNYGLLSEINMDDDDDDDKKIKKYIARSLLGYTSSSVHALTTST